MFWHVLVYTSTFGNVNITFGCVQFVSCKSHIYTCINIYGRIRYIWKNLQIPYQVLQSENWTYVQILLAFQLPSHLLTDFHLSHEQFLHMLVCSPRHLLPPETCQYKCSVSNKYLIKTLKLNVAYSSQGSHTGQLDFWNWLEINSKEDQNSSKTE